MRSASLRVWIALALAAGGLALVLPGGCTKAPASPTAASVREAKKTERKSDRRVVDQANSATRRDQGDQAYNRALRIASSARGEVLVRAAWGSGPSDLGHTRPAEGAPEGPMSFAKGADGSLAVLDQVNSRVVLYPKGQSPRSLALPADTYQDIELDPRGGVILLDRLATQTVAFLDAEGHVRHTIPLVGPGIESGGMVSGLFARADGVWLEVEHRVSVRIADASGEPDPTRPAVDGRFSSDGQWLLSAAVDGRTTAKVSVRPAKGTGAAVVTAVSFDEPVLGLMELDTDQAGRVYLVVHTFVEDPKDPSHILSEHVQAVVLGQNGTEVARRYLAVPTLPEEQFRPIRVGSDGSVYQLVLADAGATIERFGQ
jgi:hypothetical protein